VPWINFDVGLGGAVFVDAGWIGADWDDLDGGLPGVGDGDEEAARLTRMIFGGGVGVRGLINDSFVIRIDLAFSPDEEQGPGIYMPVGNAI
jgi:hypothetical protein